MHRVAAGGALDAVQASEKARVWDLPDLSLMMLATGCRIGECLAIGWDEVDLDQAAVSVCWRLVRRTGVGLLRLSSTKTGQRGERLIPLPSWAVAASSGAGWRSARRCNRCFRTVSAAGATHLTFAECQRSDGSSLSADSRVWREVRDQVTMDGLVSHTLLKTVANFLDDSDVSTRKISDQLGHARVSMTQDRYLGRKLTDGRPPTCWKS